MTKVVIFRGIGGFGLSEKAIYRIAEIKGVELFKYEYSLEAEQYTRRPKEYYEKADLLAQLKQLNKPKGQTTAAEKAEIERLMNAFLTHFVYLTADLGEISIDDDDGSTWKYRFDPERDRTDAALVQAVVELGAESINEEYQLFTTKGDPDGKRLKVVEIPDDVEWYIESDDMGYEWIAEKHRTWS